MSDRFARVRDALSRNGWRCERLAFDDAHRRYGERVLPKITPSGRQSVLDRLCVTVEAWTVDGCTVLFATCEADTLIDTVCWETGNPAVFTPSLKHVERLAAGRTVNVIAHSGRPHHQVLRVA